MRKRNTLTFTTTKSTKKNIKLYLSILLVVLVFSSILFYEIFSYKLLIKDFISYFDNNNFSNANNILITKENSNPLKSLFMKEDITQYFNNKLSEVNEKFNNGELSSDETLTIISEIKRYNFINVELTNSTKTLNQNNPYSNAVTLYNNHQFVEAYNSFKLINSTDSNYNDSLKYIDNCKKQIKSELLKKVDTLCEDNYYTKSLEEIDKLSSIIGDDKEIIDKISSIKDERSDYLVQQNSKSQSQATSSNVLNSITSNNVNNLNIESLTSYLIHVNINTQKTSIYKGSKNKWNLTNTFNCSTGITSESTPTGIYTIKEKGKWFFSDKYQQGGKYWVQFYGDYLFHSLPYNKSQSEILDYTLGKPASHGCIRLEENHAKWIYDNIPAGTKVIIK